MSTIYYFDTVNNIDYPDFASGLNSLIDNNIEENQEIIYLCIGSDRSTGDSLGPLVGYTLESLPGFSGCVYGTLKNPVHAVNLSEALENIYSMHGNPFVIAIDASLGLKKHVGYVTLGNSPLRPGLGVKKELPEVGDISITGIVNFSGAFDSMVLQTTRLSTVMELSCYIARGIAEAAVLRNNKPAEIPIGYSLVY